ncbi:MAG TPA: hypothetical protein VK477_07750, partial [Acidobacteriota bacterium]|nr:hypothetical protein [Acidobacteriota bacterium]
ITDPAKVRAGQTLVIPGFKAVPSKSTATKSSAPKATNSASKSAPATSPATTPAEQPAEPTISTAPHFDITPPPPGQDLDAGLKDQPADVPTIKVEEPKTTPPPKG